MLPEKTRPILNITSKCCMILNKGHLLLRPNWNDKNWVSLQAHFSPSAAKPARLYGTMHVLSCHCGEPRPQTPSWRALCCRETVPRDHVMGDGIRPLRGLSVLVCWKEKKKEHFLSVLQENLQKDWMSTSRWKNCHLKTIATWVWHSTSWKIGQTACMVSESSGWSCWT